MVIAVDPEQARDQYERAVRRAGRRGLPQPDGTATLTGHGLARTRSPPRVSGFINWPDKSKRAGHPGRLDQIKADVYWGCWLAGSTG